MTTPTPAAELLAKIDTMPAGPELDAAIARHVFGYPHVMVRLGDIVGIPPGGNQMLDDYVVVPNYSRGITDAWRIVDAFDTVKVQRFYDPDSKRSDANGFRWEADVTRFKPEMFAFAGADSAPLAICRAALRAVLSR